MVRNFGERRSKKKGNKKSKGKGPRGGKETEESSSQEMAIYVPPGAEGKAKVDECHPSKPKNVYRSKRMERQRGKKDRSKDDGGYNDYPEDEDEDEDDLDFGGEYDEIIRTGPSRREAREAREAEQMASTTVTFIDVGATRRRPEFGTSRRGRRGRARCSGRSGYGGYSGGGGGGGGGLALVSMAEFSMIDLIMMAIADRFSI